MIYGACFAVPVHRLHAEDIRLWRAFETKIAEIVWPPAVVGGPATVPDEAKPNPRHGRWAWCLTGGQLLVTILFALALVYAVYTRANQADADKPTKSKVSIEQNVPSKVVVEPTGK